MLNGIQSSLSGILSGLQGLGTTANNVANLNTPGFKSRRTDLVSIQGGGSRVASTSTNFLQGPLDINSGRPFDVAVSGDGFFAVDTPQGTRFSRNGNFQLDGNGRVVDSQGNPLRGVAPVASDVQSIRIQADGLVSGVNSNGETVSLGQIELARFANPGGLSATGNSQFSATAASGPAQFGQAGQNTYGTILSGVLEQSNVNIAEQVVSEISNARAVESNIAMLKVHDELLGEIIDIIE